MEKIIKELEERRFIKDITDRDLLIELLNKGSKVYIGFDPTATSLHLGHLLPINFLIHLKNAGVNVIAVLGGATGMIGDPKEKSERKLLSTETALENAKYIKAQLQQLIAGAQVVNNFDWTKKIDVLSFLRDYGKYFSVSNMIAKDTIARRLETGISYTEFSYMVLQSLDFAYLAQKENCFIQFGGSDQWGNITCGVDLIRKKLEKEAVGGTIHLLLTAQGQKFGKSEGNAVFLNSEPHKIYQYFLNTADLDIEPFLKVFTFLPLQEISKIVALSKEQPEKRLGQKILAQQVTTQLFSKECTDKIEKINDILFSGRIHELEEADISVVLGDVPTLEVSKSINIIDALLELRAVSSKSEGRKLVEARGISIDGEVITRVDYLVEKTKNVRVVKKGKKNYYLLKF